MFKNKFFSLLFITVILTEITFSKEEKVYSIPVTGVIDLGLAPFIKRSIKEAEKNGAKFIILNIDTFGGRVDAATQIRDALIETKIKTIAFVNKRAISAGALIALSCKEIVMAYGSTIGAATPVQIDITGNSQAVGEKYISYVRKEFKTTAETNGYPTELAEAMVDSDVEIKGLKKKGKLLTLTNKEALKYKLIKYEANDLDTLLEIYQIKNKIIITLKPNWAESFVRFLTHPMVSSLLLSLGFIGLLIEFKAPGWGLPGTAGVICLLLYFGGHYIIGLAGLEEILLFIFGIVLITIEFFIPGFGIFGITGLIALITSIFLALISRHPTFPDLTRAITMISSSILISAIFLILFFKYFSSTFLGKKFVLKMVEESQKGFSVVSVDNLILNKEGIALTDLRPVGKALIETKRYDVITEGGYIGKGTKVQVKKIEGNKIIVKKT